MDVLSGVVTALAAALVIGVVSGAYGRRIGMEVKLLAGLFFVLALCGGATVWRFAINWAGRTVTGSCPQCATDLTSGNATGYLIVASTLCAMVLYRLYEHAKAHAEQETGLTSRLEIVGEYQGSARSWRTQAHMPLKQPAPSRRPVLGPAWVSASDTTKHAIARVILPALASTSSMNPPLSGAMSLGAAEHQPPVPLCDQTFGSWAVDRV